MMNNYRIERVVLDDLERLIPLFDEYRVFYRAASDREGARVFLADRLKLNESVILMVVEGKAMRNARGASHSSILLFHRLRWSASGS